MNSETYSNFSVDVADRAGKASRPDRELILLLHALWKNPGLAKVAEDLVEFFPHRLSKNVHAQYRNCPLPAVIDRQKAKEIVHRLNLIAHLEALCMDSHAEFSSRWITDLPKVLRDYQSGLAEDGYQSFTETSVSKAVFETLNYALATAEFGPIVCIEANPGHGKTFAAQRWTKAHLGFARYVTLRGLSNKASFFRAMADGLGIAHSEHSVAIGKAQANVERFLICSKPLVVIDEAHLMFGRQHKPNSHPGLIDWMMGMQNEGVPFALVTWSQFGERLRAVESATDWAGAQLARRITRYKRIPAPTEPDYLAVARSHFPEACSTSLRLISKYALYSCHGMQGVTSTVRDAQLIARENGREIPSLDDVRRAVRDFRMPSDKAQKAAFTGKSREATEPDNPGTDANQLPIEVGADALHQPKGRSVWRFRGQPISSPDLPPENDIRQRLAKIARQSFEPENTSQL